MRRALGACALGVVLLAGCVATRRTLGDQCELNSECTAPLACSLGRCRNACAFSRDCDIGLTCVVGNGGLGVCQLPEETRCASDSDCPESLACRMGTCANECVEDRDCVGGASCVEVDGALTCVDEGEGRCVDDIDCLEPLVCGPFERCVFECVEDRDCPSGAECAGNRCARDTPCRLDFDCDDGDFCNGPERCDASLPGSDARGCAPAAAPPCAADEICDPAAQACADRCEVAPDLDEDGVVAVECGGQDCDDDDPAAFPDADERCNEADDDCDSEVDEGFDLTSDPSNCGACGNVCPAMGGEPTCEMSACNTNCAAGFADCNADPTDGCEAELSVDPANCSMCGMVCPLGQACAGSACDPTPFVEVAAGESHSCARRDTGGVVCWGSNSLGQLGDGTFTDSTTPVAVRGMHDAIAIDAGEAHSCALRADGTVWCWGGNLVGQLGDGTTSNRSAPVRSRSPLGVVELGVAGNHTCVRRADGLTGCWGDETYGELGGVAPRLSPSPVTGLERTDALFVGPSAICDDPASGPLRCVGRAFSVDYTTAGAVPDTAPFDGFSLTDRHGCALEGGALRCWGYYRDSVFIADPEEPMGASGVTFAEVSTGRDGGIYFACARETGGAVSCVGRGVDGQIGSGGACPEVASGLTSTGLTNALDIDAGERHVCAALADGSVRCWGSNEGGQLGDGTTDSFGACRSTPVAVRDLP